MPNKKEQRFKIYMELSKGLIALANISAGSFFFGQALSEKPFNYSLAIAGIIASSMMYFVALKLMKKGQS